MSMGKRAIERVLLIDVTGRPLRVITLRRAALLIWDELVYPLTDEISGSLRSPSYTMDIPAVLQLKSFKTFDGYKKPLPCTPNGVHIRDNRTCQFVINGVPCDKKGTTVDHIIPQSKGGKNTWDNLISACQAHNSAKADNTMEEMARRGWEIRKTPKTPDRSVRMIQFVLRLRDSENDSVPESWKPFFPNLNLEKPTD